MMTRMFKELTEDLQKQLNEFQESTDIKLGRIQKQLNELKEEFNEHKNKTEESIF
jgi:chaperonin cofactor prefoldin